MIDAPPGALFSATFDLQMPQRVEETLCVYPTGSLWYWSLAADTGRRNRAGTFMTTLDDRTQRAVGQITDQLIGLPPRPAPSTPSGAAVTLRVEQAGRRQTHTYYQGSGVPAELQAARDLLQTLLTLAEAAPYSVVRLAVQVDPFPPSAPAANGLFLFENPGTQPVVFTLTPNAFRLGAQLGDGQNMAMRSLAKPVIELTDGNGKSHGGLYRPAQLAPGERAALSFLDAIPTAPGQVKSAFGALEGQLSLHYPEQPPAAFPNRAFSLSA